MTYFLLFLIVFLAVSLIVLGTFFVSSRNKGKRLASDLSASIGQVETLTRELSETKESIEKQINEKALAVESRLKEKEQGDFTLKRALKRSEESNFMKNAFLSNISHEIRTPLNNIVGFASLLEAEISLLENKELYDYACAITESGDRLLHLLNNIIDISKVEANDMQISLRPGNINNIVANSVQLFIFKANEQKLKLNLMTNDLPEVMIDEKGLTKVISSVVENAVKYTTKGFVNVSTDCSRETGEVSIRIKDTGIGIDPSYLPVIFDPFRQDSLGFSKENQGAGLGLPLAKRIIDLMRGRIEIESTKGHGTTVTIFFPTIETRGKASTAGGDARKQKFRSLQGLEIFIVEDDLMNKIVLYEMTKTLGNVVTAVNGDETMQIMEKTAKEGKVFDIMLFDINLPPPWDGTKLMLEIRKKWPEYQKIPFVAQTAYAMTGDKEKLLEAGFDDYISKPINQQELYSIIKNQLNKL